MKTKIFLLFLPLIFLIACTSAEQTTDNKEKKAPEVYVFDDVSKIDSSKIQISQKAIAKVEPEKAEQPSAATSKKFVIQLGAFTSKERAESFIKENQSKTSLPMNISFNGTSKLYSVQIPGYNTKEEADMIRDNLRKFPAFKDSFTLATEK